MKKINIAIDGPAGAGKSTIARKVAQALNYVYIDTGAMYRAVTWKLISNGVTDFNSLNVLAYLKSSKIELFPLVDGQKVLLDGLDVTLQIRSSLVTERVSIVASIAEVREFLVAQQKQMANHKGVVMDGRDIGTTVIPDAEIKIYLTASTRERAIRRMNEWQNSLEYSKTLEEIEADIVLRDQMDQQREISPLIRANDAILMDSTFMTIDDVVNSILKLHDTKLKGGS